MPAGLFAGSMRAVADARPYLEHNGFDHDSIASDACFLDDSHKLRRFSSDYLASSTPLKSLSRLPAGWEGRDRVDGQGQGLLGL